MRKLLIILLFAAALLITGCSDEGTLRVLSYSMDEVWFEVDNGDVYYLYTNEYYDFTWDLSTSLFGDEEKDVTVTYGGGYWFWYDYEVKKTVKPGSTAKVEIIGDAGEIAIWNNSNNFYVEEVYLSPSSDTTWGEDDLVGYIGPGETVTWKVSSGYWDIKLVDDYGDEFVSLDNYINPETTTTFEYTGFKKSSNSASQKKENSKKYKTKTEDLCEMR